MTPNDVASVRARLGLTIEQLSRLIGVTERSLSGWESGASIPSPWGQKMLSALHRSALRRPNVGERIRHALLLDGPAAALYEGLRPCFDNGGTREV